MKKAPKKSKRPNILLVMADEYRYPRHFDTPNYGMLEPIKNILGFREGSIKGFEKYFPGFVRLRENAVVLRNHTIAASACVPSRATMFTGQYGALTGVTQTDGVFKAADDPDFPWLTSNGIPTLGDWFRADGYETHYFGKCHFADPPDHSLQKWGFDSWEQSFPEPHGSFKNNLGLYRDHGFADLVTTFLRGKGLALDYDRKKGEKNKKGEQKSGALAKRPWFAVASFTNPHDITTYPMLPAQVDPNATKIDNKDASIERAPLTIPAYNTLSNPPEAGTWKINLNPLNFPQDNANLPPNWEEPLDKNNKPDCQYDYSYKLGIALASGSGNKTVAEQAPRLFGLPFQLTSQPEEWSTNYLQYYTYLHYALDQQIDRVLKALDETGLRENTIVIFAPDHGEYGAAHGMMLQKWHSAYQEAIHVPVVVCMPPGEESTSEGIQKEVEELTSHIDLLPTLLGLAGVSTKRQKKLAKRLMKRHDVPKLRGADLSKLITSTGPEPVIEPDGSERKGVLFVTDDMITEPLNIDEPENYPDSYKTYLDAITFYQKETPLQAGPVCQPCYVQCVREKSWKLVRYHDVDKMVPDQWEMYHLDEDPNEMKNLLVYNGDFPTAISGHSMGSKKIKKKAKALQQLLKALCKRYKVNYD